MSSLFWRNILISIILFLGIGALGGGALFILSPSGELMQMPLSQLEHSPFRSFLIPGIVLFFTLGVFPLVLVYALMKKPVSRMAESFNLLKDMHWSWTYTIYLAVILISWIQIQMVMLQTVHWLHTFYTFYGILIIGVSLLPQVRMLYTKKTDQDNTHDTM